MIVPDDKITQRNVRLPGGKGFRKRAFRDGKPSKSIAAPRHATRRRAALRNATQRNATSERKPK